MCAERRQHGLTLVELIVFIVIVGVALAGVLTVLNHTTRHSADPLLRKQALAIAEALLEEVTLQPFTWCDPDDANAATATAYAGCTVAENNLAAEAGEARASATPLDNVNDYHGVSTTTNIAGGGTAGYAATVTVAQGSLNGIAADASLLITVSVTAGGETIQLQAYRTRYSPNTLP
ncbi:MAG: type II secretion system protein [Pseudomonadota bacterium]